MITSKIMLGADCGAKTRCISVCGVLTMVTFLLFIYQPPRIHDSLKSNSEFITDNSKSMAEYSTLSVKGFIELSNRVEEMQRLLSNRIDVIENMLSEKSGRPKFLIGNGLVNATSQFTGSYKKDTRSSSPRTDLQHPNHGNSNGPWNDIDERYRNNTHLPNLIIFGTKKSGTTSLTDTLTVHPDISAAGPDEVHFFDMDKSYNQGYDFYRKFMPKQETKIVVEKTPKYFLTAADRIHAMNSSIRLLVILKDPVNRLLSDYHHEKRLIDRRKFTNNPKELKYFRRIEKDHTFDELVFTKDGQLNTTYEPVRVSMYDVHLQKYMNLFPREHIFALDGETFYKDPFNDLYDLEDFLGIPHHFNKTSFELKDGYYSVRGTPQGETLRRKYSDVSDATVTRLRQLYAPHARRTREMLGRQFTWPTLKYL